MPLESATYIHDLVASNPAHTDGVNQGDAHLRLIKATLLNTFPNFTDVALNSSQSALDAAVNVITGTSGQGLFPSGTQGSPSISFASDVSHDSGLYWPGENSLGVTLGGAEQVLFATTGTTFNQPVIGPNNSGLVPAGAIIMYQGTAAPSGWAWLNGGTVTSASNPQLNAIYGNSGGNITLPDWRCYAPVGIDGMGGSSVTGRIANSGVTAGITTMNSALGEATHALTIGELASHNHTDSGHTHTASDSGHTHTYSAMTAWFGGATGQISGGAGLAYGSGGPPASDVGHANITVNGSTANITNTGSGTAHNNTQLSIVTGFIIKLG